MCRCPGHRVVKRGAIEQLEERSDLSVFVLPSVNLTAISAFNLSNLLTFYLHLLVVLVDSVGVFARPGGRLFLERILFFPDSLCVQVVSFQILPRWASSRRWASSLVWALPCKGHHPISGRVVYLWRVVCAT